MNEDPDLKINLKALERHRLTLLAIKDGQELFRSAHRGLLPLVDLLETEMDKLIGTTVVDRVVGSAAAKLLLWQHVKRIDAGVASERARELLRHSGIEFNYARLVPELCQSNNCQPDRYELLSVKYDHPELFYRALREELLIFKSA